MDDYLSEKEQLEQIRDWFREYGWYLFGGVVLGAALLFGRSQWDDYRGSQAETASAIFQQLRQAIADDADAEAVTYLEQLRAEYPSSPYTDQAGLVMVLMYLQNGSTRQAIETVQYTLENTNDEYLAMVARTRLARLLISAGRQDEAMTVLDEVEPGNFAARFSELRGDIYFSRGDNASARAAWQEALNSGQSELVDRALIQMKIDDLPPEVTLEDDAG